MEQISTAEKILDKCTGPFGALILSLVSLWWLSSKFEMFIEKTIEQHNEDRELYKSSIQKMTEQLVINSEKMDLIKDDVKSLSEDVKELKKQEE